MYLVQIKTLAIKALRTTFDADYPEANFRSLPVEMEYPVVRSQIPSVWVDFDPVGPLRPVGIGHVEDVESGGTIHRTTRWSFAGNVTFTAIAMSALERDRIIDEMVAIIAFGQFDDQRGEFRTTFENDPLIAVDVNWDEIDQRGFSASPGTPWATDEMLYEGTLAISMIGEFVSSASEELLVPISGWTLYTWVNGRELDPVPDGQWLQ